MCAHSRGVFYASVCECAVVIVLIHSDLLGFAVAHNYQCFHLIFAFLFFGYKDTIYWGENDSKVQRFQESKVQKVSR
jgi:hypothetical protein